MDYTFKKQHYGDARPPSPRLSFQLCPLWRAQGGPLRCATSAPLCLCSQALSAFTRGDSWSEGEVHEEEGCNQAVRDLRAVFWPGVQSLESARGARLSLEADRSLPVLPDQFSGIFSAGARGRPRGRSRSPQSSGRCCLPSSSLSLSSSPT